MDLSPADWRTSSYSSTQGGNCVECRTERRQVLIRDSQHRAHGHLAFPTAEWRALLAAVRDGEL